MRPELNIYFMLYYANKLFKNHSVGFPDFCPFYFKDCAPGFGFVSHISWF